MRPDRTVGPPVKVLGDFGYDQGWRVGAHPRLLEDLDGDGRADIVGFGHSGTYVSYGRSDGGFTAPVLAFRDFGVAQGWSAPQFQRTVADANGDGIDDIVGFGHSGTIVSYGRSNKTMVPAGLWLRQFGQAQGWRADLYPSEVADVNGDGHADVVGFGYSQLLIESL